MNFWTLFPFFVRPYMFLPMDPINRAWSRKIYFMRAVYEY